MTIAIRNMTRDRISILLNSRSTLHVPAGGIVEGIAEGEVLHNAKIAKLEALQQISLVVQAGGDSPKDASM